MDIRKCSTKDIDAIFDASQRFSVGFDDLFYRLHSYGVGAVKETQYPPYNIVKESDIKWRIELALAGWDPKDIEVSTESNVLVIKSKAAKDKEHDETYVHRGVSSRSFARGFNLSDDVEIGTVGFQNGLLVVELTKVLPEHQKLKVYEINTTSVNPSSDTD